MGLEVVLGVRISEVDYMCRGPVQGFKVILHSPNELPDVNGKHFPIPVDKYVQMSIKPNVMVTSKSLKDYSPEKYIFQESSFQFITTSLYNGRRQCYFNSERTLRHMKIYTQQNCYLECIANLTLKFCGCAKSSSPRLVMRILQYVVFTM